LTNFKEHTCLEAITGNTKRHDSQKTFGPHALSAPALAPAVQHLVSEDPRVKPKTLCAHLEMHLLETPTIFFAQKVKAICKKTVSTTKEENAGAVSGFVELCKKLGNHATVRIIDDSDMEKVSQHTAV